MDKMFGGGRFGCCWKRIGVILEFASSFFILEWEMRFTSREDYFFVLGRIFELFFLARVNLLFLKRFM